MKTVNVLVTGIGGPIAQGMMMGLHQLDHIRIIGADRRALTSGHHFCDRTYQGSIIFGVDGSILNCPLSSRQVNKQNICAMYDTFHPWLFLYRNA